MEKNIKRLTRKQLVDYIKQIMPEVFSELEKAAFIEMIIAKRITFDEEYAWGDKNTRQQIYELAKKESIRPKQEVKRKLICVTMAELYGYVAEQFGLEVQYQKTAPQIDEIGDRQLFAKLHKSKQEHVCPIVKLSDGRLIKVDIQSDLHKLQTHSRPSEFGNKDPEEILLSSISREEIDSIFKKIYGLQQGEDYTNEYLAKLNMMLSKNGYTPEQKIINIINDPRMQKELQSTGATEAKKVFKLILRNIVGDPVFGTYYRNGTHAHIATCSLSDETGNTRKSFYLFVDDEDEEKRTLYIYSKKTSRMVNVTPEDLYQMKKSGMTVSLINKVNDIDNRITRYIKNAITSYGKEGTAENDIDLDSFFDEEK